MKTTHIQKWGNSYGVRVPKDILKLMGLKDGSKVTVSEKNHQIVIAHPKKKETLADLLARVTLENRHELVDWGSPVGKEVW
ncbi:MAG: AbrB/MazE/SpoVT family DNA-binding domain-containing protein [Patescibacteria group bacterium]